MLTKTKVAGAFAALALSAAASAANAYVIDFTSSSTGTRGTLFGGSVVWELYSDGLLDNSDAFDGASAPAGTELSFETDGFGTGSDASHWIGIDFSAPVLVDAFHFLNLFSESSNGTAEYAWVVVNGGEREYEFVAGDDWSLGAAGFIGGSVDPILASSIRIMTGGGADGTALADGTLASISIAPVPVPAAGAMLLAGIGGLAALRRRRKA